MVEECQDGGALRTEDGGGGVRGVWMVLDGSKEASLPSRGDKPSLALQQRVTHSVAQWSIQVNLVLFFEDQKGFWKRDKRGGVSPQQIKCFFFEVLVFYILSHLDH